MRTPKTAKADVSFIRQETQFSCCAASLASALKAHGKDVTEADVNKVLGASPMSGARWEEILSTVQYFGMRGTLVVPSTIAQLKAWTDAGIPVIIAWTPRDRPWAHASVVYNVDDTHVHVMDPNLPDPNHTSIVLTHEEFYSKWFEKFSDTVFVRRPAMAIEREVTVDGRQVMAGKKELRSQKDRGMSRHLKHGPDPLYDVPPSWEKVRRPKTSQQPLMTRRDYGVTAMLLNTKDFERALRGKTAVNLPADVERYVKEVAEGNPDYTDEQVWATAWSIFCRANPDSEHCHQESYLKAAALNKTAGYSHYWEVKTEIDPAVWAKIVAAAKKIVAAAEAQGIAVRGPMGTGKPEFTDEDIALNGDAATRNDYEGFVLIRKPDGFSFVKTDEKPYDAVVVSILAVVKKLVKGLSVRSDGGPGAIRKVLAKFPRGESMTVDEVAEVVGPEFREMNENPPESVKKVQEEMKKKAHRPSLLAMDAFAEMLKDSKFEKGKPADPTENMTEEDAAEWERQTEEHKDEFKTAAASTPQVMKLPSGWVLKWNPSRPDRVSLDDEGEEGWSDEGVFVKGRLLFDSPERVPKAVQDYANAFIKKVRRSKVAKLMARQEKILKDYIASAGSRAAMDYDSLPQSVRSALEKVKDQETLWSDAERFLGDNRKLAAVTAGGKYGFTKGTESACGVGVNKLQKSASRIAKALYAKDDGSPAFLAKHATKGGSKTASMILKAMESIGPMAALVKNGKTAGDDFYTKALANGWEELRGDAYAKASRITGADVDFAKKYGRKTVFARYHGTVTLYVVRDDGTVAQDWFMTLPNDGAIKEFVRVSLQEPLEKTAGKSGTGLYGFSEKSAKLGLDACTALHHEAGMIAGDLFARKGADPMKVAGYLAANAKKGKCAYSAMLGESAPDIDAAVIAKKASDFLASVDDAEVDSNEEVLDIISKCG